jgi:serine/threonine protein kinase
LSLEAGTRLGNYAVVSPLGAGGMGEVDRATDTKLGRDVAIKVLPPEVAQDPERLGRFKREAQLLAALNHPNVGTETRSIDRTTTTTTMDSFLMSTTWASTRRGNPT